MSAACVTDQATPDVSTAVGEIGKSCGSSAPSMVVTGGFATTYTSPRTYSDCYRGEIVEMDKYDWKYEIGGYTKVAWADTAPSAANCTASTVGAYLFRRDPDSGTWIFVTSKEAHGDLITDNVPGDIVGPPAQPTPPPPSGTTVVPKDPSLFGPVPKTASVCMVPVVYFFGNETPPGYDYKIVTSARLPGPVLQKVSFTSVAGWCGQGAGSTCCWNGDQCADWLTCNSSTNKCDACGGKGQKCCLNQWEHFCNGSTLACKDNGSGGICSHCGNPGEPCCDPTVTPTACNGGGTCNDQAVCVAPCGGNGQACCGTGTPCGGGLSCQSGKCLTPPPPCGANGQACCTTGVACNAGLSCQGSTCAVPQSTCNMTIEVTLTACQNYDGTPSTIVGPGNTVSVSACGSDQNNAEQNAALEFATLGFGCVAKNAAPGCCTFSEDTYQGCYCQ